MKVGEVCKNLSAWWRRKHLTYATHAHASGVPARDLHEIVGHTKVEKTMRCIPSSGVRGPLDAVVAA